MIHTNFEKQLVKLGACSEARTWAKGKTFAEVWQTCDRGDWLLWLCAKMIGTPEWPTHQTIVLAACDCAELGFKYLKEGENRPQVCIAIVRRWAEGKATLAEVKEAKKSAYAYAAADAAAAYAAYSAAAAYAAYSAAAAADAAADAYADAYADADDADAAAAPRRQTLKTSAHLVRIRIPQPKFED